MYAGVPKMAPVRVCDGKALSRKLHHEEVDTVFRDVVVEDPNRSGVLHGIGRVPFAEEAVAQDRMECQAAVEHLDRDTVSIAQVGCRVDGRHTTHAEDALQPILPSQDSTDSPPGSCQHLVAHERCLRTPARGPRIKRSLYDLYKSAARTHAPGYGLPSPFGIRLVPLLGGSDSVCSMG
jgi:hypothetical protein